MLYFDFFGYNFLSFIPTGNQITGIFKDEQILGSYVSRLLPMVISFLYIFKIRRKKLNIIIILLLLISLIVILFSGERTALLSHYINMLFIIF